MARIAGVNLPNNKRVEIGLQYIYGVGPTLGRRILSATGVNADTKVEQLTEDEISRLRDVIEKQYKVEGDLRREVQLNVKRLIEIGCYRGMRHRMSLPAQGQRTRTNARTKRGPRKTVAGRGKRRGLGKK